MAYKGSRYECSAAELRTARARFGGRLAYIDVGVGICVFQNRNRAKICPCNEFARWNGALSPATAVSPFWILDHRPQSPHGYENDGFRVTMR
jgi:hypothetical protein